MIALFLLSWKPFYQHLPEAVESARREGGIRTEKGPDPIRNSSKKILPAALTQLKPRSENFNLKLNRPSVNQYHRADLKGMKDD